MTNHQNDLCAQRTDQPGHPPSLIRILAVRVKKPWVLSYPMNALQRLWSDWADAQADLSLHWAHRTFWLWTDSKSNKIYRTFLPVKFNALDTQTPLWATSWQERFMPCANNKKDNKQCLFDTPCTVMVNKEKYYGGEYKGHTKKGQTKWLSLISCHFVKILCLAWHFFMHMLIISEYVQSIKKL